MAARLLPVVLLACLPAAGWAQETVGRQGESLAEELRSLDARAEHFRARDLDADSVSDTERDLLVYRRAEWGLSLLRDLNRLMRRVAALPEDDPQRQNLLERFRQDLTDVIDFILDAADELGRHIASSREKAEAQSGASRVAHEAYIFSLGTLRLQYYQSLGDVLEVQQSLGLPVTLEAGQLEQQLYLFAEALAGRLEFSGAALTGLRARLRANPENAELVEAERAFAGEHSLDLERLAAVSRLLGRLGLDNLEYQNLLLKHGKSVSVRDFDSDLIKQRLRDYWEDTRIRLVDEAPDSLFRLVLFLSVLLLFYYLSRLARRGVVAASARSGDKMSTLLKDMLASVSGVVVIAIGLLIALSQIGISLGPMLAGLGVAGFIVGFALQDTLANFAAGGMILAYRPYDVGDVVEVAGAFGTVKKMNLVSTTITTFDNQTLVVPNSKIWGDVIKNVTAQRVRRVDMEFGISYSDDIGKAERILRDIIEQHDAVLRSPEAMIKLHKLGDSSVNFIVRPWVKTADYWDVYWDVTREVKVRFDRENISIPFPQRDVHIHRDTG